MPGPGIQSEISDVEIGADRKPVVTFSVADAAGVPLALEDVASIRFLIASIVVDEETGLSHYENYILTEVEGSEYTFAGETMQPAMASATQPTFDTEGEFEELGPGQYAYTFANALPEGYDQNATHVVGALVARGPSGVVANPLFTFVPAGGEPEVTRLVSTTETCNGCHDELALHGGARKEFGLCVLCHTPQNVDPETGNTPDFKVMIHKIHRGEFLPSVQAGEPYYIVGFRQSVHNYSTVVWPQDVRNCTTCHTGPQGDNYKNKPNAAACGACHDQVNFETGENHPAGPQTDATCATCHMPEGEEFDLSVVGTHTIPEKSAQLSALNLEIIEVTDTGPDQSPTVVFKATDDAGTSVAPEDLAFLEFTLAGPTTDYANRWSEQKREGDVTGITDNGDGTYSYTFDQPIPADASGSYAVGMGAYQMQTIKGRGGEDLEVRVPAYNPVVYVPVTDDEAVPRRTAVKTENCNACHKELALHGGIRRNTEYCVMCHNAFLTDEEVRPEEEMPPQTVHYKVMIHRIHTGEELVDTKPHIIYGFQGSIHDFSEVRFPGDRRNCEKCHEPGAYTLPLPSGVLPTTITQEGEPVATTLPIVAACTACHDTAEAKAHAALQTTADGEETCAVCHGQGKEFDAATVHR